MSVPTVEVLTTPKRKRRGARFWIVLALVVVAAMPMLVYLLALGYVKFGFADDKIAKSIGAVFGAAAMIGSVRTEMLQNIEIHDVTLTPNDGKAPGKVGSIRADWDISALLRSSRINSVSIDNPALELRRDGAGKWNYDLSTSSDSSTTINQFFLRDGEFAIEWSPGQRVHLQGLQGSFTRQGAQLQNPFSLSAVFDSLETISATGSLGPGAAWTSRLYGGFVLERDLQVAGLDSLLRGHLKFDLSAKRESLLLDATRGGEVLIYGRVTADSFRWKPSASSSWSMPLDHENLDIRGNVVLSHQAEPIFSVADLHLDSLKLGKLELGASMVSRPGLHLKLENGRGTLDWNGVNRLFDPPMFGESFWLTGPAQVSKGFVSIPCADGAPELKATLDVHCRDLIMGFKGLGEFSNVTLDGEIDWPAVPWAKLKIGNAGTAQFRMASVMPEPSTFLEVMRGTTVADISLDVARCFEFESIRRAIMGTSKAAAPALVADMPYLFSGLVTGKDVNFEIKSPSAGTHTMAVNGLRASGVVMTKWPFTLKTPPQSFSGPITPVLQFKDGSVNHVQLSADIASGTREAPGASAMVKASFGSGAGGVWKPHSLSVETLRLTFADLERMFSIASSTGITGTGTITATNIDVDPSAARASGKLHIGGDIAFPFSAGLKSKVANALTFSGIPSIGADLLRMAPLENLYLSDLAADLDGKLDGGKLIVNGQIQPGAIGVKVAAHDLAKPLAAISVNASLEILDGGMLRAVSQFGWNRTNTISATFVQQSAAKWQITGQLSVPAVLPVPLAFETAIDTAKSEIGPGKVRVDAINLSELARSVFGEKSVYDWSDWSGQINNISVEFGAFRTDDLALNRFPSVRLKGNVDNGRVIIPAISLDQLSGFVTALVSPQADGLAIDLLLKLSRYEALTESGIYIPPPPAGRHGILKWTGKIIDRAAGEEVRIDKFEANLGDQLRLSAEGSLNFDIDQGLSEARLTALTATAPDLADATSSYITPNIRNRMPWFGNLALTGFASASGTVNLNRLGAVFSGKLNMRECAVVVGGEKPLTVADINGDLPLSISSGVPVEAPDLPIDGELRIGPLDYGVIRAPAQALAIRATRNSLRLTAPLKLATPAGTVSLANLGIDQFTELPTVSSDLSAQIELNKVLRDNGININGFEECVLSGPPVHVVLKRVENEFGPWQIERIRDGLAGPLWGGEIAINNFHARGLFGPAPVFGVDVRARGRENAPFRGIQLGKFLEKNPGRGAVSLRAQIVLDEFEATNFSPEGIQKFTLNFDAVSTNKDEYFYDGEFAMSVNYKLVRDAFPGLFSDEHIRGLKFGIRDLSFQYWMDNGELNGPIPKLDDMLILKGYGAEINPFAGVYKKDFEGSYGKTRWTDFVKQIKELASKPAKPKQ